MSEEIWAYILLIGVPVICFTIYEIIDRICECREKESIYGKRKKKDK